MDKKDALRRRVTLRKFRGKIGNHLIDDQGQLMVPEAGWSLKVERHDLTGATVEVAGDGFAGTEVSGGRVGGGAVAGLVLAGPLGAAVGAGAGALLKKSRGLINVTLTLNDGEQHHYVIKGKDADQVHRLAGVVEYLNRTSA